MKRLFLLLSALLAASAPVLAEDTEAPAPAAEKPDSLHILMIGNSFSVCVGKHLPNLVASCPGLSLDLVSAYIGGCSFERHWNNILATNDTPTKKQYKVAEWIVQDGVVTAKDKVDGSINDLIRREPWDIITIQQASPASWDYATYQPFAEKLIAFIKDNCPGARVHIQQTWAYRADDSRILPGGAWGFDQAGMHERVTAAYASLEKATGFPVIPTGRAVNLFRQRVEKPFVPLTKEQKEALKPEDKLPDQSGDVVGSFRWNTDKETGAKTFGADTIHLNGRGEYLQACTWFCALYKRPIADAPYVPEKIVGESAALLRSCADDAVAQGLTLQSAP